MPRLPRDKSGPAVSVSVAIAPRYKEALEKFAAQQGVSRGRAIELLIERDAKRTKVGT